jgi:hypothetical protein
VDNVKAYLNIIAVAGIGLASPAAEIEVPPEPAERPRRTRRSVRR